MICIVCFAKDPSKFLKARNAEDRPHDVDMLMRRLKGVRRGFIIYIYIYITNDNDPFRGKVPRGPEHVTLKSMVSENYHSKFGGSQC